MNLVVLIWNQRCGCQNDYDDYDICIVSKVLSTKFFLSRKRENSNITVKKSGRRHLNYRIKVNITSPKTSISYTLDIISEKHIIISMTFLPNA